MKRLASSLFVLLLAGPAVAHPGHGADPATHWVADLPHLAVTLGVAALAALVVGGLVARRRAKPRRKPE